MQTFGQRALPSDDTALGRELQAWREALVTDLGGEAAITTQQRALVEMAVTTRLLVSSVDAYLLGLESLVDKRHRRLWPVVKDRTSQVTLLQSILRDLGLERRAKPVPDLHTYLAQQAQAECEKKEP